MTDDPSAGDARTSVLIVDDHQMFRDFMTAFLKDDADIRIVGYAGTARDAYDQAIDHKPDVVLMDQELPDASGTETIAKIREALPATKVVMVTGSNDDDVLLDAVVAGCSGFVSKDSAPAQVRTAIRAAAAGEAVLPDRLGAVLARKPEKSAAARYELTARELEILQQLAQGSTNREIAAQLFISLNTVRNHVQRIISKLGAHSKLEAVTTAVREKIVSIA